MPENCRVRYGGFGGADSARMVTAMDMAATAVAASAAAVQKNMRRIDCPRAR